MIPRLRAYSPLAAVAVAVSISLSGCTPRDQPSTRSAAGPGRSARAALLALPVKDKQSAAGYSRALFGQDYLDTNHDGCDTRNNTLQRDLQGATIKPHTRGCVVLTGTLSDPYGGTTIAYVKGRHSPIDFEHIVALEDAWVTGAQQLSSSQREQLANDPLNVLMVGSTSNRSKRANDAAGWLPPNTSFRCAYVARQIAVKARYALSVTPAERAAMARVLSSCPQQQLPDESSVAFPRLDSR